MFSFENKHTLFFHSLFHNSTSNMEHQVLTLFQLNALVSDILEQGMPYSYWVEAELAEIHESRGHAYLDLIQTDGNGTQGAPVARAQARCWRNVWLQLNPYFQRITSQPLHVGMKLMLQVHPQFHPLYGFSWIVTDINPEYTLGDMARKRMAIIQQLKDEGVYDLQKELPLPLFTQRIAIVSAAGAAGYGDFCRQLHDNTYGFAFTTELFEATMQGEQVESTVIDALNRINLRIDEFDVVVIIRGGGATADLSGFDTLLLAENVANFPLPVITGIGHDSDESILDMIAHTRVKTPTAAAAFLIDHLREVDERIDYARQAIAAYIDNRMQREKQRLAQLTQLIPLLPQQRLLRARHHIDLCSQRINAALRQIIDSRQHRLSTIEVQLKGYDPTLLLRRGYSITLKNGKAVTHVSQLDSGDTIETRLLGGTALPTVTHLTPDNEQKKRKKQTKS